MFAGTGIAEGLVSEPQEAQVGCSGAQVPHREDRAMTLHLATIPTQTSASRLRPTARVVGAAQAEDEPGDRTRR